ncbi:MAG: hypothetical protein WBQ43_18830 [Terriglobales bacterium]
MRPSTGSRVQQGVPYPVLSPDSLHAYNIHKPGWKDALRRYLDAAVPVVT